MKKNIYLIYGNHFSYLGVKHIYDLLINDFKNYNFIISKNIKKTKPIFYVKIFIVET